MLEGLNILLRYNSPFLDVKLFDKKFRKKGSNGRYRDLNGINLKNFIAENYYDLSKKLDQKELDKIGKEIEKPVESLDQVLDEFVDTVKKKTEEKRNNMLNESGFIQHTKNLSLLVFPNQTKEDEKFKIFNHITEEIDKNYDRSIIEQEFKDVYSDDKQGLEAYHNWRISSKKLCTFVFDRSLNKISKDSAPASLNLWKYNLYTKPKYLDLTNASSHVDVEDKRLMADYLTHLFPNNYQREYCLAWVYTSLTSRHETFLCLVGAQGVGKSLFMSFVKALHGEHNCEQPKDPKAQFNSYIKSKTFIIYDEIQMGSKDKEVFKRIANNVIQVEEKGKSQENVVNNASICLASNYIQNLQVEPNDRRFSIPDLGTVALEKALGKRKANRLFKLIEQDYFLKWFYDWLVSSFCNDVRVKVEGEFNSTSPLKNTRNYEKCCNVNASDEIKFTINFLKERDFEGELVNTEFTFKQLYDAYKEYNQKTYNRYKRVSKNSIFYDLEAFKSTIAEYTYESNPFCEVKDNGIIINTYKGIDV